MPITYRELGREEIVLLKEIDRSEVIDAIYYYREGKLELENEYYDMKGFPPGELDKIIDRLAVLLDEGGSIIGAFDGDGKIVRMTAVEKRLRGRRRNRVKMDILFVSSGYRMLGIGKALVGLAAAKAREIGAEQLYISAVPSRNAVNFYLNLGCRPAAEVDPELLAMEPEDIHLELNLQLFDA